MSKSTTVGKLLLQKYVPQPLKEFVKDNPLDKKGISQLFAKLSEGDANQYRDHVTNLTRLGFEIATRQGSTVPLDDLSPLDDKDKQFEELHKKLDKIKAGEGSKKDKEIKTLEAYSDFTKSFEKSLADVGLKKNHTLAKVIKAGARGSMSQYRQTVGASILVNDEKGRPMLDFPVQHSFAEGLTIPEYLAHSYGTRQGAIATKLAIADSGYFSKQLSRSSMPIKVEEHDCRTEHGVPMPVSDRESIGAFLAQPAGKYKRNNEITGSMLSELADKGVKEILVRSPITCQASRHSHNWAVCQLCIGKREKGTLPELGSYIGVTAATALGEPLAQGQLNCLEKNTLVRMADYSVKRICDIKVGDLVLGADAHGRTFPSRVINVWDQGIQPVSEYIFRSGKTKQFISVEATEIHPILSNIKKWSCLGQKNNKDIVLEHIGKKAKDYNAIFPTEFISDYQIIENKALLLGLLLGDACYTKSVGNVNLSSADAILIDELKPYLASFNLKLNLSSGYYYRLVTTNYARKNPAKEFLKSLGCYGKYAHEKTIPSAVYTWDNKSVANLVAGLLITDGSVYHRESSFGISFASTSKVMLEQLRELLAWRFTIYTSAITKTGNAGDGNRNHDQWQFTITTARELKLFAKYIPLLGVKKYTLAKLLPLLDVIKDNEPGYLCKRQSIIHKGLKHCFDLSVEHEDSLFVLANGLIVHNTKHTAGAAALGKTVASGFRLVEQLANPAQNFQNRAGVAEIDGVISTLKAAPQGGFYIGIKGAKEEVTEYVPSGFEVHVKLGQHVEAGDILSEGIVNPADIVKHKGIGEGRRYYTDVMHKAFGEAGMGVNRRNFEVIAKGAIDHVKVTHPDGIGEYLPDSIISYQGIEKDYTPRPDSKKTRIDQAKGKYLEEPVLHLTIGTRLSSSMIDLLKRHKIDSVLVADNPPPFAPTMLRLLDVPGEVPDWAHQLNSSYLEKRLIKGVNEGISANLKGPSPILGLSYGVGFGDKLGEDEEEEEIY